MFREGLQIYSPYWGHASRQSRNNSPEVMAESQTEKAEPVTEAALFRRCRKALGLSQPTIARAMLIASDRTVRRWEQSELTVAGLAWVALEYLLRESNQFVLADKVAEVVQQRRWKCTRHEI